MKTLILFIAIVLLPLIKSQSTDELVSPTPTVPTGPNNSVPIFSSTSTRLSSTFKQMTSITPTPSNDSDNRNAFLTYLKYIYIIAGVILFLVLIIIILLAAMCILCQRKYSEEKEQKRKQKKKGVKPSASPPTIHVQAAPISQPSSVSPSLQSTPVHVQTPLIQVTSPKRKTDNVKGGNHGHKKTPDESGSMTDFPLLCRVLQDYDSADHNARIRAGSNEFESSSKSNDSGIYHMRFPSGTSSDLEASIGKSTTTSYISNDYDELDNVFELLKTEGASPHKTPPKTLPKPSRAMSAPRRKLGSVEETTEPVDAYGYHTIDIRKLGGSLDRSDSMKRSQSANGIFDDPKYDKLPLDSHLDVPPPHLLRSMLTKSDNPKDNDPRSALLLYKPRQFQEYPPTNENKSSSMKRSYSTSTPLDTTAFDKRDYKEYMSLQQLLDLVNTKMTPSRETSADIEEEEEELYCPRVVLPVAMEMT